MLPRRARAKPRHSTPVSALWSTAFPIICPACVRSSANSFRSDRTAVRPKTPLRFLLADKVDLLRDTNVVSVYSDDVFSTVVIEERQTLGGRHRLMLMFDAKDLTLKQWTVTDPQGFDTTVAVYDLDMTKKPDPALFKINYERLIQ